MYPVITISLGSKIFKFRECKWLFSNLNLSGDETVLDVGCGHGLLLIEAAKRLTTGKAYGIDLWFSKDQASNSIDATTKNAKIEGVLDKIELKTCDMTEISYPDSFFSTIISSWAIHNIKEKKSREKALMEINRVLQPGGKVAILDIFYASEYAAFFKNIGFKEVKILGPRYTFGNKTYLLLANK